MTAGRERNRTAHRSTVSRLVEQARHAQQGIEHYHQQQIDRVVDAAAWAIIHPENNRALAAQAVADTGLGDIEDKVAKNYRKTIGLLRDLQGKRTVGVINEIPAKGIIEIARPVGVVAAVTPSTNPVATVINNIINAIKCRNAIILAPSPAAAKVCARMLEYIHHELDFVQAPRELVQMLPIAADRAQTETLLQQADLVIATGSPKNIAAAAQSGTPAFGVSAGNVASIISETADIEAAAARIAASKTFDNATSCSAENSLIIPASRYRQTIAALLDQGGVLLTPAEKRQLQQALWPEGKLARHSIARPVSRLAEIAGLTRQTCHEARFLLVEEQGIGPAFPFSGEKLSPVLTLYQVKDFHHACETVQAIYRWQGAGHSVGLHTRDNNEALQAGLLLPASRVIVNQAHCFATGGNFNNGLPFTLTLGCGTWGKNHFSDNLNYRHFFNLVRVSSPIPESVPALEDVLGGYLHRRYP
ncbi:MULTISPECIES: acylating sulfoacetaldehyde dehydrogenase [unclassified Brenneria]|uniref:acylating sulfoacetaldehyde dehydrogenase n=1 Tax=unclassified Brenneria TaxID=2634434 RepID=UPI001558312E|nr:aldehyde dehydrogenase family protein [Brenneria sp. hezel4-2-4]MEE3651059.1 aldehyde dehydrogenase family protein [Brenneria sp. HEZEL_4_2_4]NPD01014.1 aldehyde dehydrogenase family protein [Brenneria sp. hezel4-2-4]